MIGKSTMRAVLLTGFGGPAWLECGRLVAAGAIAGTSVSIDLRVVYLKHLEIFGSTLDKHQEFTDVVRYIEEGKLKSLLARSYPLEKIKQAQHDFMEKRFFGKLVLVP